MVPVQMLNMFRQDRTTKIRLAQVRLLLSGPRFRAEPFRRQTYQHLGFEGVLLERQGPTHKASNFKCKMRYEKSM